MEVFTLSNSVFSSQCPTSRPIQNSHNYSIVLYKDIFTIVYTVCEIIYQIVSLFWFAYCNSLLIPRKYFFTTMKLSVNPLIQLFQEGRQVQCQHYCMNFAEHHSLSEIFILSLFPSESEIYFRNYLMKIYKSFLDLFPFWSNRIMRVLLSANYSIQFFISADVIQSMILDRTSIKCRYLNNR